MNEDGRRFHLTPLADCGFPRNLRRARRIAPVANIDEMAGDRRRRRHRRRHEMRAARKSLPTLEIAIRGRGAALAGLKPVRIHGEAHRAAGLAPFESRRLKIMSRPSASACCLTSPEPGTTMALTREATRLPSTILAAARKSSMRPLVQEPMKTRSISMSVIFSPPLQPHIVERARDRGALALAGGVFEARHLAGDWRHVLRARAPGDDAAAAARRRAGFPCRNGRPRRTAAFTNRPRPRPRPRPSAPSGGL